MKKTMKEQRVKRQRKTKQSYSIAANNLKIAHPFITSAKKVYIIDTPPHPHPPHLLLYPQRSYFGLSTPSSWTSLIGIQNPTTQSNFGIFLENFNNEVNIVTYSFFFANAQIIYYSHIYNKTDQFLANPTFAKS